VEWSLLVGLTAAEVERAGLLARQTGEPVDAILTRLGLVSEADLAATLARLFRLELLAACDLNGLASLSGRLPLSFLRQARAFPVAVSGSSLCALCVRFPLDDAAKSQTFTP